MASDNQRRPMNVDTAMLLLSFVALSVGCLILALDLFLRMQALFGEHVPHEMGISDLELKIHELAESGEDTEEFDYAAFIAR